MQDSVHCIQIERTRLPYEAYCCLLCNMGEIICAPTASSSVTWTRQVKKATNLTTSPIGYCLVGKFPQLLVDCLFFPSL